MRSKRLKQIEHGVVQRARTAARRDAAEADCSSAEKFGSYEIKHFGIGDFAPRIEDRINRLRLSHREKGDVAFRAWKAYVAEWNDRIASVCPGVKVAGEE